MKNYYRVMLGKGSIYAAECIKSGFIGVGWFEDIDLTSVLTKTADWRAFNKEMIPIYLKNHPEKKKVAAGLSCGFTHTVCKGMAVGDVVLTPKGDGTYAVGEISSDYIYVPGADLPHRRFVNWYSGTISKTDMSVDLKNSAGSIGTVSNISRYASELEALLQGQKPNLTSSIFSTDENVLDPSIFALEKHLEDFLIANWKSTELSKSYDIYEDEGEIVGQQYMTDTGPIDILAISKDRKELLVIELKKGRVSDVVVGQIQRYMGYAKEELCEEGQTVKGLIIGLEDDNKLRRALSVTTGIDFYRYKVDFQLIKGFSA
jgi:restriction system protein